VLRAGLRLLKAEEEACAAKLQRLKAAIQVGLDSYERGEGEVVDDVEDYFDELEAEIES
jgi:Arc/MetJ-type ribon-helix-helix transcriptional regulator